MGLKNIPVLRIGSKMLSKERVKILLMYTTRLFFTNDTKWVYFYPCLNKTRARYIRSDKHTEKKRESM